MKVYLCGPINGCADSECKDWRLYAMTRLPSTIDPMARDYRGREMEPGIAQQIVGLDKVDIGLADALLVNYLKPSVGTSMEILYAWERGKLIVTVADKDAVLSPWLVYHSHYIVHTMSEAIDLLS